MKFLTLLFLFFLISFATGAFVLKTSQAVKVSTRDLLNLEDSIKTETDRISVLEAEWTHLNSPTRLRSLAYSHSLLRTTEPITQMSITLIDRLPYNTTSPSNEDNLENTSPSPNIQPMPIPPKKPSSLDYIAEANITTYHRITNNGAIE